MTLSSKKIIENYLSWLKDNLKYRDISENLVEIQTPFVDSQNDFIMIFIKKEGNEFILTDDGRTLFDLNSMGVSLTDKRIKQLNELVNSQGALFNKNSEEIYVKTDWNSLPRRKNDLLQSLINVSDMFLTSQVNVKNLFYEEVALFLTGREIAYIPNTFLNGSGGVKHKIDFIIARVGKSPQLIRTVNNPNKSIFENELFKYLDIDKCNDKYIQSEKILLINDSEKDVRKDHIKMIESYGVKPILWSERESAKVF
jgi:hypothetical protein